MIIKLIKNILHINQTVTRFISWTIHLDGAGHTGCGLYEMETISMDETLIYLAFRNQIVNDIGKLRELDKTLKSINRSIILQKLTLIAYNKI